MGNQRRRNRGLGLFVAAVLALAPMAACSSSASSDGSKLTFVSSTPPNFSAFDTEQWWVEEVEERTNLEISLHQNSSLLPAAETVSALRDGRADIGYLPLALVGSNFPLWSVAGLPFLSHDAEAQQAVLTRMYANNDAFREEFEGQGLHVLFFIPLGSGIIATKEPIESLRDLEGDRVRSFGLIGEAVGALGTDVVPLDTAELYEALQRGNIDSVAGPLIDSAVGMGLHEVVPHFTDAGIGLNLSVAIVMSKKAWDNLSDEDRSTLEQVSKEVVPVSLENLTKYEELACEKLREGGGEAHILPEELVQEWRDQVQDDLIESWRSTALKSGASEEDINTIYEEYRDGLAELNNMGSYTDGLRACAMAGN